MAAHANEVGVTSATATCDPGASVTFTHTYHIPPGENRTDHWVLRNPADNTTERTAEDVTGGPEGAVGTDTFTMVIPAGTQNGDTMTLTITMVSSIGLDATETFIYDCSTGEAPEPTAPVVDSVSSRAVGVAVSVSGRFTERVSWDAHVPGDSGADLTYELATKDPGASSYVVRYTGAATSRSITVAQGNSRIRVVAIHDGVRSPSRSIGVNRRVVNINPLNPPGTTWKEIADSASVGRDILKARRAGASARFTLPTAKGYTLVARTSANGGTIQVWVDGKKAATVSLQSSSTVRRKLVWSKSYSTSKIRRIEIRLVSGRADLDAFLITR
jgi:hypothetical protein